ncbi:MAG: hypothetical protein MJ252_27150 [archaeon]|nr:hypothetical protein [archaeon]
MERFNKENCHEVIKEGSSAFYVTQVNGKDKGIFIKEIDLDSELNEINKYASTFNVSKDVFYSKMNAAKARQGNQGLSPASQTKDNTPQKPKGETTDMERKNEITQKLLSDISSFSGYSTLLDRICQMTLKIMMPYYETVLLNNATMVQFIIKEKNGGNNLIVGEPASRLEKKAAKVRTQKALIKQLLGEENLNLLEAEMDKVIGNNKEMKKESKRTQKLLEMAKGFNDPKPNDMENNLGLKRERDEDY